MKYTVSLEAGEGGSTVVTCAELGVRVSGMGSAAALDAIRDEIRYRLELCPCTSVGDDFVELDVG